MESNDLASLVSRVHFFRTSAGGKGPRASGFFTLCDVFSVNFSLWESNDGSLYISLPRKDNPKFDPSQPVGKGNTKFYDECQFVDAASRESITAIIVKHLEAANAPAGGTNVANVGNAAVPKTSNFNSSFDDDPVPF